MAHISSHLFPSSSFRATCPKSSKNGGRPRLTRLAARKTLSSKRVLLYDGVERRGKINYPFQEQSGGARKEKGKNIGGGRGEVKRGALEEEKEREEKKERVRKQLAEWRKDFLRLLAHLRTEGSPLNIFLFPLPPPPTCFHHPFLPFSCSKMGRAKRERERKEGKGSVISSFDPTCAHISRP